MQTDSTNIVTIIATGIAGALSVVIPILIRGWLNRRAVSARAGLTDAEADSFTIKSARELMDDLRKDNREFRRRIEECENDRKELHRLYEQTARELAKTTARLSGLEVTLKLFEERLRRAGLNTSTEAV